MVKSTIVKKVARLEIESHPGILGGKPIIKGTRIPVTLILELIQAGVSPDKIVKNYYPHLSKNVIKEIARLAKTVHETVSYERAKALA